MKCKLSERMDQSHDMARAHGENEFRVAGELNLEWELLEETIIEMEQACAEYDEKTILKLKYLKEVLKTFV